MITGKSEENNLAVKVFDTRAAVRITVDNVSTRFYYGFIVTLIVVIITSARVVHLVGL